MREAEKRRRASRDDTLVLIKGFVPPPSRAVPLVACMKNAIGHVASFLEHYRRLGVDPFLIVDDGSTDGTAEWLARQEDVVLFRSALSFSEAQCGRVWRDTIIDRCGRDRWYVCVDADEFLIYPGSEKRPVTSFIRDLEREGFTRSLAPMIDLYPFGPLAEAPRLEPGAPPWTVATYFDAEGYTASIDKFCLAVRGGPRSRLFGTQNRLTKFPLLFADRRTGESGASAHAPFPFLRNYAPPTAILLHYKFHADTVTEFRSLAAQEQHHNGAEHYKAIVGFPSFERDMEIHFDGSVKYRTSDQLLDMGFMKDLR